MSALLSSQLASFTTGSAFGPAARPIAISTSKPRRAEDNTNETGSYAYYCCGSPTEVALWAFPSATAGRGQPQASGGSFLQRLFATGH